MGQIVGGAAKPKRCNIRQLSQLVTPAAGEYILVSSDNSMNAAGQGNFDCYIKGDGRTAATALELKSLVDDGIFDISAYHATGDVLAKYADLSAALGANGANIPQSIRKGGISVKFVQSSDNKYVQWRCMAQNFTIDVTQWQGVDDEPTAGSDNLVKSGGVYVGINQLENEVTLKLINNGKEQKGTNEFQEYSPQYSAFCILNSPASHIGIIRSIYFYQPSRVNVFIKIVKIDENSVVYQSENISVGHNVGWGECILDTPIIIEEGYELAISGVTHFDNSGTIVKYFTDGSSTLNTINDTQIGFYYEIDSRGEVNSRLEELEDKTSTLDAIVDPTVKSVEEIEKDLYEKSFQDKYGNYLEVGSIVNSNFITTGIPAKRKGFIKRVCFATSDNSVVIVKGIKTETTWTPTSEEITISDFVNNEETILSNPIEINEGEVLAIKGALSTLDNDAVEYVWYRGSWYTYPRRLNFYYIVEHENIIENSIEDINKKNVVHCLMYGQSLSIGYGTNLPLQYPYLSDKALMFKFLSTYNRGFIQGISRETYESDIDYYDNEIYKFKRLKESIVNGNTSASWDSQMNVSGETPCFGFFEGFWKSYTQSRKKEDIPFYMIMTCNGRGATGIDMLADTEGYLYTNILKDVTKAMEHSLSKGLTYEVGCICWLQGEADFAMSISDYKATMKNLVSNLNTSIKNITGQVDDVLFITYQCRGAFNPCMAQAEMILDTAYYKNIVFSAPCYQFEKGGDNLHLTSLSSRQYGNIFGDIYYNYLSGVDITPIRVISSKISQNDIILRFNKPIEIDVEHVGDSICRETITSHLGFYLMNNGSNLVTSSEKGSDDKTIIIHCSSVDGELYYGTNGIYTTGQISESVKGGAIREKKIYAGTDSIYRYMPVQKISFINNIIDIND